MGIMEHHLKLPMKLRDILATFIRGKDCEDLTSREGPEVALTLAPNKHPKVNQKSVKTPRPVSSPPPSPCTNTPTHTSSTAAYKP